MADISSLQLPPLADWQAHERLCHALWMKIWQDPHAQLHGRSGQAQRGVDVYGTPTGVTKPSGVQCKAKDRLIGTQITEKEVLAEVEEAKKFRPALGELIIATSAESDVKLQDLARRITEEHRQDGLFGVYIYSWKEIVARLAPFTEIVDRFYGQHVPTGGVSLNPETTEKLAGWHGDAQKGQADLLQAVTQVMAAVNRPADGPAHAQLDMCRKLLEAHSHREALPILEAIREREWSGANNLLRFRIATNLGAAHWGLGDARRAGEFFLEAYEFDRTGEKALTNRATGLMLLGRQAEALPAAREAVELHPESALAWAALINIQVRAVPNEPIPEIPSTIADDPQLLFVRADAFSIKREWVRAEAVLRRLLALPGDNAIARSRLAEVLITQATGTGRFHAGASYSSLEQSQLDEARDLLQQSWNAIKDTGLAKSSTHIVQNWCAVVAVMGKVRDAEPGLDQALALDPDNQGLLTWKIRMAAAHGDGEGAMRALSRLVKDSVPEYGLLEAVALRSANQKSRALEVLESFIPNTQEEELATDARCLFADLVCEADPKHAEMRFAALPHAGTPAVARSAVIFARALRHTHGEIIARPYLERAREQITKAASTRDQLVLADALSEFGDATAAVEIYERCVSTAADTESLREYLRCLLNLDQRQRLRQRLDELPAQLAAKPHFQWVRGNLAVRVGDLPNARLHYEACLKVSPKRFDARLRWAEVCLQINDPGAVADWLAGEDIAHTDRTLDQLLWTGKLLTEIGRADDAVNVLYTALRRFPNEPRAHLIFTGAVLFEKGSKWLLEPDALLAANLACGLRDSQGQQTVYIIEDMAPDQIKGNEISVQSALAQRLVGRRVGDQITTYESEYGRHESTLTWIKHKYVHALHETLQHFNTRFPEEQGFIRMDMPVVGTPEEKLGPILKALQNQNGRTQNILELYREQGLPIAMLGKGLGRSPIEMWRLMVGQYQEPVVICAGTAPEREEAYAILQDRDRRYIADPLTFFQLQAMSMLDVVEQVCGRLAVVQSTIDDFHQQLEELDRHPDGQSSVVLVDGQPRWHELTAADIQRDHSMLTDLLNWIAAHCDVVPAIPQQDLSAEASEMMDDALGSSTYDTLLAASGTNLVLLSDDWYLRRLGKGEVSLAGIWIQPVLQWALHKKYLNQEAYARALAELASWRHRHISVRAEDLHFAAGISNEVSPEFRVLASTLTASKNERRSLIGVVVNVVSFIWGSTANYSISRAKALTYSLLDAVDPGASNWCAAFYAAIKWSVDAELIPKKALPVIQDWYRERKLPPFDGGDVA